MKKSKLFVSLIAAGAFLFNLIFWKEQLALNAVLFDFFMVSSLLYLYEHAWKNNTVKWLLLAHVATLCSLLIFNSLLSKISFSVTFLLLVAFAEYAHRSVWYAGGSLLLSFIHFAGGFLKLIGHEKKDAVKKNGVGYYMRMFIFPLAIAMVFFAMYSFANNVFFNIANTLLTKLSVFFGHFFDLFSFDRILFLFWGFYLTGSLLLRARQTVFEKNELAIKDDLRRIRKKRMDVHHNLLYDLTVGFMGKMAKGTLALKNEYRTGLISLVLLNVLLLIINIIDIDYLWIHFTYTPAVDLYTMIHEGTELLILSIVLAMLVLLIFFRGNLNFYKNNKWLKVGACLWLVQNAVLVCSVLLRDYYYIREFGLAYKRIGVLFFLLLVMAGLVTVFLKVQYAKTNYYLLRLNAWCVLILLVASSMVQWDVTIAEYNIAHRKSAPLNLPYLLTLSDKVLPVLNENLPALKEREKELNEDGTHLGRCTGCIESIITERNHQYLEEQSAYTWLSWNYTDASAKQYFLRKPLSIASKQ